MKVTNLVLGLLAVALVVFTWGDALAEDVPGVLSTHPETEKAASEEYFDHPLFGQPDPPKEGESIFKRYERYMNRQIQRVSNMDLYGVTAQLPKGYLAVKWDWGMVKASRRFDNRRRITSGIPPIEFTDGEGNKQVSLDLGLTGRGGGHTFQVSYGITDPLDWYIEVPFTYMDVRFDPIALEVDEDGNRMQPVLGRAFGVANTKTYSGTDFLKYTLPTLGRATPAIRYKGRWVLGNINTGFSWNIYRTPRMSVALTPRIYLPTGRIANPDNSLLYGTGPELDVSVGGWGVGFTQGYDFRIWRLPGWLDFVASSEFTAAYWFPHKREYPSNFVKPSPVVSQLDPTGSMFPDLTGLKGKFTYWPGWSLDWTASLNVQVAILALGVGYGIHFAQEPEIYADHRFVTMVRGLELLGEQTYHTVQAGVSVNLLAVYIPLEVAFQYKKMVDGYNAIILDNFFQITLKTYIPVNPN